MLLDRRKVKFWQKIVFGFMAVIMAGFLIMIPITQGSSCGDDTTSALEEIDQAIAKYQAAVKADPKDVDARIDLAENYTYRASQQVEGSDAQTSDWEQAARAYKRADKLLSTQKGAAAKKQRLEVLEQLAGVYLSLEDYEQATGVYGEITALRPKDAQSYFDMATVAISAGDTNTALLAFNKFLELDPKSSDAAAVEEWIEENAPSPAPTKGSGQ